MFDFNKRWKQRLSDLYGKRPYKSQADFIKEAEALGLDADLAIWVHDYFIDYCPNLDQFGVYLEDRVIVDYEVDEEDLEFAIMRQLRKFGIPKPKRKETENFLKQHEVSSAHQENVTVHYIIQFLQFCRDR